MDNCIKAALVAEVTLGVAHANGIRPHYFPEYSYDPKSNRVDARPYYGVFRYLNEGRHQHLILEVGLDAESAAYVEGIPPFDTEVSSFTLINTGTQLRFNSLSGNPWTMKEIVTDLLYHLADLLITAKCFERNDMF
ncbi:MAG: hypothetical protein ABR991_13065 [Terracidiphilus sp.]|jgi:hypothetical protein